MNEIEQLHSSLDFAQKAALEAQAYALKVGRALEMWLERTPSPPQWHWSYELHALTREALSSKPTSPRTAVAGDIFPHCQGCPWTVGDIYQRDCDYPRCVGIECG